MSTEITINQDQIDINVDTTVITIESPTGGYPLPSSVYSVFGRVGNVVAQEGDYTLTQLGGVTITNPLSGQALVYNGTSWVNNTETYTGTVTSVNMSVPTGLTISGNPITTAGTLALGLASGYSIPTTANQANWTTAYNDSIVSAAVTGVQTKTLTLNQQDGGTITASWSDYDTAPVTSVFGRTGAITAQSGDYNTLQVTENTNLYFTNQRARFAISGDATSGVVYSNTTGIIALDDIPNTSLLNDSVTINGSTVALGGSTSFTTSAVAEGTNLYYTQARFNSAFAAKSTTDLAEGTNLYFTTARAQSAITGTSPISVTSGNVSITQANGSTDGYLSSADWTAFNAKQAALTFSSPLVNTSGTISIPAATSSSNGYLTSTDWTTFNSKQSALSGTGFVKINGTTISYDNSTYLTTIEGIAAGGELSGTYASPSLVNSAVTGKVLTGVNITGGSISASDSILTAFGKVQNQINGLVGGSIYQGTWNASTNTPALASGVGTKGYYYIVSVAGSTNLDGITDWNVGDWAIYDGTAWQQVDNTDAVVSVNGFTGAVSLTTSNISEGTNLYYTDARARGSVSAGTGISYNSTSGVITNSAPDQTVSLTGAGTTSISGTYPNFTITSNDQYVGTVTSVGITESSAALTITGSPVTTSGNINIGFAGSSTQYVAGDGSLVTFPTSITEASNLVTEVYNASGATLTKGTVVYINGGQGNLPTITKAQANNDANSAQTYGMVQNDITNNNNGYVVVIGNVTDLDTQAYAAGTQLYLSPTTAGAYTDVKQYAPNHLVYVGIVIRSHPTQGVIEVKIQNGYEMDELHNVSAQSPNNGDILQYVSSTGLWTKTAGTTSNIAEGSNLYYTDARARGAVSLTTTGNNGASTYNSTTGVLNVPTYTLAGLGGINLTSLSATSPLLYDNTTGVFSIQQSSGSQAGFLSAADWTTFNSKQNAITLTTTGSSGAATLVGSTLNIPNYGAALSGYLPLTGGTLTGDLRLDNGSADGGQLVLASSGFSDWNLDNFSGTLRAYYGSTVRFSLTNAGAATFSSSVTATNGIFTDGTQGLNVRAYTGGAGFGAIYSTGVTAGAGNFALAASSTQTILSGVDNVSMAINSAIKLYINNAGNVGIGTTNPVSRLSIGGDGYADRAITAIASGGDFAATIQQNSTGAGLQVYSNNTNWGNDAFKVQSNGGTQFVVRSSGNVGIGTSSPASLLNIVTSNTTAYDSTVDDGQAADGSTITIRNSSTVNNTFAQINMQVSGDSGRALGRIVTIRTASATSDMAFVTESDNTKSEKMRITSGGQLIIGNTASIYTNTKLAVCQTSANMTAEIRSAWAGDIATSALIVVKYDNNNSSSQVFQRFVIGNGDLTSGQINANGANQVAFGSWSDIRLKENVENLQSQLDNIMALRPVEFDYKDGSGHQIGFIAQEMQEVYADAVGEDSEGFLTITGWSKTEARLVKALQEAVNKIEELNAKVTALENK